jgi:hypothetical protein
MYKTFVTQEYLYLFFQKISGANRSWGHQKSPTFKVGLRMIELVF